MLKRLAVVLAWIIATFATATITLAAVGRAGSEVSDRPAMPISSAELAARIAASTTTQPDATTTIAVPLTQVSDPNQTETFGDSTSTIPDTTTSTSQATTTTAPATTTTSAGGQTTTYEQPGVGRVTIKVSGQEVTYVTSVILGSGYHVEVDDHGPEKVIVKFDKEGAEYVFIARFVSGSLEAGFGTGSDD